MKKYNIHPVEQEFSWGKMSVVELGERGRGRKLNIIPFHADEDSDYLEIGTTKSGMPKIIQSKSSEDWLARINTKGCYTRGTNGWIEIPSTSYEKNIEIIASGYGAYGDAGRIGNYSDFLLIVKDNTLIKICPSGGSHKQPRYWLFFGADKVSRIKEEEIDIFIEKNHIELTKLVPIYSY
jgi:hypothetical protein